MATIRTSIQIQDNMSRAFQSMNTAMNVVINSFESLQSASSNAVDTASIQLARQELARAETAFNDIDQGIQDANQSQQQFNGTLNNGASEADGLLQRIIGIAAAYLSFQTTKGIIALSDEMTNTTARLDLMNDQLQTTTELQEMIFQSAKRTYSPYQETANMVGKLGMQAKDAFSGTAEIVAFAEQINKTFVVAGTSVEGVSSVMLQLTQAMAAGTLQGEELGAILDNAQPIVANIADYLEVPVGSIKKLASEGKISAEIIKYAMFAAAEETNAAFETMPVTFSRLWTNFQNDAFKAFQPVLQGINDIANNDKFKDFIDSASGSLYTLSAVAMSALDVVANVGGFMYDNWSVIGPLIGGVTTILLGYAFALGAVKLAEMAAFTWKALNTTATLIYAAAMGIGTGSTWAMVAAAWGLNAALAANPIFIVIMAIAILIGIVYAAVAAINFFAGTSISATGIIAGTFMVLGTAIYNVVAYLWNIFASIAEFFVNVWQHPMYSVKKLFGDLAINVLDQAIAMSSGWDDFATSFVNAMIDAVNGAIKAWNWFLDLLPDGIVSQVGLKAGVEYSHRESITSDLSHLKDGINAFIGETPADYWEAPKMDIKSLGDAWDTGYNWGADLFGGNEPKEGPKGDNYEDLMSGMKGAISPLKDSGKKTAGNTAKMAKSMEGSEEDLKHLRDLAERDVINRFTTASVKVDFSSVNTINSDLDLDGIIDQFTVKFEEALDVAAEGV